MNEVCIEADCETIIQLLTKRLEANGMRVAPSFNLRDALRRLPAYDCPQHGTAECTCAYAVLLVSTTPQLSPVQVILHGCDGWTWIKMVDDHAEVLRIITEFEQTNHR